MAKKAWYKSSYRFAKWKELSKLRKLWRVTWILGILVLFFLPSQQPLKTVKTAPTPLTAEQIAQNQARERKRAIEKLFLPDGSSYYVNQAIKRAMNDPDSFEHVETVYKDTGTDLIVTTRFRGANAYGAKVLNTMVASLDMEGHVELLAQE